MEDCEPLSTSEPTKVRGSQTDEERRTTAARSAIGSFEYFAGCTLPDIPFAEGAAPRQSAKPGPSPVPARKADRLVEIRWLSILELESRSAQRSMQGNPLPLVANIRQVQTQSVGDSALDTGPGFGRSFRNIVQAST